MKVVDLHPEELLDKDARGELTELERERLEAHLARCSTCRFERQVRLDFAEEVGDSQDGLSSQRLIALMNGLPAPSPPREVVPVAPPPVLEVERVVSPSQRPQHIRRSARVVLLVAAALFAGGAATAGAGAHVWARIASTFAEPEVTPREPKSPEPPPVVTAVAKSMLPAPVAVVLEPPVASVIPVVPVIAAPARVEPAPAPIENATTLFDAANEARRQGDYTRAILIHRRLQATHPTSREAHVSQATVGRLLLDRGDAAGALESFDAYRTRGKGPLDEAVTVGRATALERLGRSDEARSEWQSLLAAFPDTPYAEHARMRVDGGLRAGMR